MPGTSLWNVPRCLHGRNKLAAPWSEVEVFAGKPRPNTWANQVPTTLQPRGSLMLGTVTAQRSDGTPKCQKIDAKN